MLVPIKWSILTHLSKIDHCLATLAKKAGWLYVPLKNKPKWYIFMINSMWIYADNERYISFINNRLQNN